MSDEETQRTKGLVRLWVRGEDYGVMSEKAAGMYLEVHRAQYPTELAYSISVPDDAPMFLPREVGGFGGE